MSDDSKRQYERFKRTDRRSFLKAGTVTVAGMTFAGCSSGGGGNGSGGNGSGGNGSGGNGSGSMNTENLSKSSAVESVEQKLPDYYPDDYWRTLRKAEQEGTMTLYTAHFGGMSESYIEAFNEFCPFINVQPVNLSTSKVYQRFSSEAAQGVWEPDVVHTYDPVALQQMNAQDLFQNYQSPEKNHYADMWKSDDGTILATNYNPYANAWHPPNTNDPPMTLETLAKRVKNNPDQWKNNFAMYDAQLSTSMWQTMLQWREVYGDETMKNHMTTLSEASPRTFWSTSTMGEWVARGEVKYGIALAHFILDAFIAEDFNRGKQVQWGPADDIISNIFLGGYQVVKKPSNPNAAKVFFDWFNSPRGQKFMCNTWNVVATHDQVGASDVESEYPSVGKLVHENMVNSTEFVWGYDYLSKQGGAKSGLKTWWYETFVGGG